MQQPTVRRRASARAGSNARWAAPTVLALVLLGLWQLLSFTTSRTFLPGPVDVLTRLAEELGYGRIFRYAGTTFVEALLGTFVSALIALPLGYLVARVRLIDLAASPFIAASQAVPAIAIAPLLALWIGYGLPPIVVLCAVTAFFPMLVTTTIGIHSLDRDMLEAATLDGAGWWARLRHIELPLAFPSIVAGIRAGAALSVTGAVVGEFTMGGKGLGMLLTLHRDANDTEGLFATLLLLIALAVLLFGALGLLVRLAPGETSARQHAPSTSFGRGSIDRSLTTTSH